MGKFQTVDNRAQRGANDKHARKDMERIADVKQTKADLLAKARKANKATEGKK
ncbi:MAG: hypothetical protein LBN08_01960 [Lactobacillales bacterium]|jgi:hypothetical protein|nr:hypothetical protein [Lactobacillales bacterium]